MVRFFTYPKTEAFILLFPHLYCSIPRYSYFFYYLAPLNYYKITREEYFIQRAAFYSYCIGGFNP